MSIQRVYLCDTGIRRINPSYEKKVLVVHGWNEKNYSWSAYVRSLLYANASVMQTLLCVVQDNLFEWYLGMYLELEHSSHFFPFETRKSRKRGCKLLEEKQKQKQASPNTEAKWKKGTKKSRWEELIVLFKDERKETTSGDDAILFLGVPFFTRPRQKNELICKWTN